MKTSEKIVQRLKNMGLLKNKGLIIYTHRSNRHGSFSWCVSCGTLDIGSSYSMNECLKWKRWIYDRNLGEIFEYIEGISKIEYGDIIENNFK